MGWRRARSQDQAPNAPISDVAEVNCAFFLPTVRKAVYQGTRNTYYHATRFNHSFRSEPQLWIENGGFSERNADMADSTNANNKSSTAEADCVEHMNDADKANDLALYSQLLLELERFDQHHLIDRWDELNRQDREQFVDQIRAVDFGLVQTLFQQKDQDKRRSKSLEFEPHPAIRLNEQSLQFNLAANRSAGQSAMQSGRCGVVIVAGGQGTRLGFPHPKGMFPIGPVSKASLLQILLEKVLATSRASCQSVPVYIMTSRVTHAETVAFLGENECFGLPQEDVFIFEQGSMPAVDRDTGRVLRSNLSQLCLSPDGHGGLLEALDRSGAFHDMGKRGVEHVFYLQVDNPLVHLIDPIFMGVHILSASDVTTQVIAKKHGSDKVGTVVSRSGKVEIVEYSDLPVEIADTRDADGSLLFWAGNTAIHAFSIGFLEEMVTGTRNLEFHFASKKVSFIDDNNEVINPDLPNAIKFERFIFDLLPLAGRAVIVEVDEQANFAPLKNASGFNTPDSVRSQMVQLHRRWLHDVGVEVANGVDVEISPLFANSVDELRDKLDSGTVIDRPTYLCPD